MVHIQSLIDREIGLSNLRNYDSILSRLTVTWNDAYRGISPYMFGPDYNPEPPIFACRFAEKEGFEHYVAIANEDGRVAIQDTFKRNMDGGDHPPLTGIQCHENAVFDLAWMSGSMEFVTVSGDHSARLWDVNEGCIRPCQVFCGHSKSVKSVTFRPQDYSVFATGARDGKILIWDTRANTSVGLIPRPDNEISNCYPPPVLSANKRALRSGELPRANSITGLVFQNDDTLISCADGDGNIKIWDLRKNYTACKKDPLPKQSIAYCGCSFKNGYTNLLFDKWKCVLYANCMDSVIYSFNVTSYSAIPLQRYVGHENGTFYIKSSLSPDGIYLISGSSDERAYIWNTKHSQPIVQLEGHSAEVTCASWCQVGDIKIVTCSDDARHKIWRIHKEHPDCDDLQDCRGSAKKYPTTNKICPALDQTPQSMKRKPDSVESSSKKICLGKSPSVTYTLTRKSSKRSLLHMLNGTLTTIKENDENEKNNLNVIHTSLGCEHDFPSSSKKHCPDGYVEGCTSLDAHDTAKPFDSGILRTPKKSPRKLTISPLSSPKSILTSPGLAGFEFPNFVLNGEAPHLGLMSPPKKICRNVDWLTRLSIEKNTKPNNIPLGSPQTGQVPQRRNSATKVVGNAECNSANKTPTSSSGHKTPTRRKMSASLLNYFSSTKSAEKNK